MKRFLRQLALPFINVITAKPGAPGRPEVSDLTATSCTLNWTAPEKDGGSKIVNYIIEMRKEGETKWKVVNLSDKVTSLTYKVRGLKEETQYEFRVTAENKAGAGQPSPAASAKYGKCRKWKQVYKT